MVSQDTCTLVFTFYTKGKHPRTVHMQDVVKCAWLWLIKTALGDPRPILCAAEYITNSWSVRKCFPATALEKTRPSQQHLMPSVFRGYRHPQVVHTQDLWDCSRGERRPLGLRPGQSDVHIWRIRAAGEPPWLLAERFTLCTINRIKFAPFALSQADCFSNDIHKLDTTTMVWSLVNARVSHNPEWFSTLNTLLN